MKEILAPGQFRVTVPVHFGDNIPKMLGELAFQAEAMEMVRNRIQIDPAQYGPVKIGAVGEVGRSEVYVTTGFPAMDVIATHLNSRLHLNPVHTGIVIEAATTADFNQLINRDYWYIDLFNAETGMNVQCGERIFCE